MPNNATNKSLDWTSSNTNVATVSSTGVVKGVAKGTAMITATTGDSGKTAKVKIKVTGSPSGQQPGGGNGNGGTGDDDSGSGGDSNAPDDGAGIGIGDDTYGGENHDDPDLTVDDSSMESDGADAMMVVVRNVAIVFVSVVVLGGGVLFIANRKLH